LLAIGELLRNAGEFMHNRYREVCENVLRFRDFNKTDKGLIRRTVISLMPMLAEFDSIEFNSSQLSVCMTYLLDAATHKKEDVERSAFLAIGQIAQVSQASTSCPQENSITLTRSLSLPHFAR